VNEGVMSLLIDSFAAPMFATNCWVLASEPGSECVVIDPGMPDVSLALEEILQRHNLKPVAVIATHGHLDHTFSIQPIADGYAIPTYIHSEDRAYLSAPEKLLSEEFASTVAEMNFVEPSQVRELRNGEVIDLVGLSFRAIHAPGHTRGSLMFEVWFYWSYGFTHGFSKRYGRNIAKESDSFVRSSRGLARPRSSNFDGT